jgi:hypothetical protein
VQAEFLDMFRISMIIVFICIYYTYLYPRSCHPGIKQRSQMRGKGKEDERQRQKEDAEAKRRRDEDERQRLREEAEAKMQKGKAFL